MNATDERASWPQVETRIECPVCAQREAAHFYSATEVPVTCASVFESREQAVAVPRGDVHLVVCRHCGFVFNPAFDHRLGHIGAQYESSQAASAHFLRFVRTLARDWVDRHSLSGKTVLEVGSGDGSFLRLLSEAGVACAIGIDPHAKPAVAAGAIRTIADTFDDRYHGLEADALVCRHTLEHIQDVHSFLSHVRRWTAAASRVVLFEVPDGERVLTERAFWDVYYEHCNYFTARTLRFAFERAGFEVLRLERAYGEQYLLLEAVAGPQNATDAPECTDALEQCYRFGADVRTAIEKCERNLRALSSNGAPLVVWQAASKTVGFLSAVRNRDCIGATVDLSVERQGKYLPGSGLRVHSPAELPLLRPQHIVLMNPVYIEEVRTQVRSLGVDARVHSINDLLV